MGTETDLTSLGFSKDQLEHMKDSDYRFVKEWYFNNKMYQSFTKTDLGKTVAKRFSLINGGR